MVRDYIFSGFPDGIMTNPTWFVMTIWKDRYEGTKEQLRDWLILHHAKEGVIGEEISPSSGKIHYQVKIHLDRGETLEGWKALIGPYGHVEVARDKGFKDYEKKDGNWIQWPESPIAKFAGIPLLFWQQVALQRLMDQDDRTILLIYDEKGNSGKTTFVKYLEAEGIAELCPAISEDINDYTGFCYEFPATGYSFDLPRAEGMAGNSKWSNKACAFWAGVERIKDGCIYERRNKPKKRWIDPPKIIIFTNTMPDKRMLSDDRWDILNVEDYRNPIF